MTSMVQLEGAYCDATAVHERPHLFQSEMSVAKKMSSARCLCLAESPLRLVVRKLSDGLILAAWPGTVELHSGGCPFKGSHRRSSNGEELTHAQVDDPNSLRYRGSWLWNGQGGVSKGPGQVEISLHWLLGEMWQSAQLSSWRPGWRRDWGFVRSRLMNAALRIDVNGEPLDARVYIPEIFEPLKKAQINAAWENFYGGLSNQPFNPAFEAKGHAFMTGLVVGELAYAARAQGAWVLRIKNHFSEFGLLDGVIAMIDPRLSSKLQQLSLSKRKYNPIVAMCVAVDDLGLLHVVDLTLMEVSRRWLPAVLNVECELVEKLIASGHEIHITKNHRWGGGQPYLVCKAEAASNWVSIYTYSNVISSQKLQQYRTKVDAISRGKGRECRFYGYADR